MSTPVVRHESELGWWEMVRSAPHPSLRPHVREYIGWFEHMAAPLCRRELPTEEVPVIINFGAPVRLFDPIDPSRWTEIAQDCGYYDQAHFSRDFRAFAGITPTELVRSLMPDGGGFLADR